MNVKHVFGCVDVFRDVSLRSLLVGVPPDVLLRPRLQPGTKLASNQGNYDNSENV